ncbi:MAG: ATP-binding protein [Anaeromyxobacteraceae bacterium]
MSADPGLRVVVLAPSMRDGPLTVELLGRAGVACDIAEDAPHLFAALEEGVGAAVIADEGLSPDSLARLTALLRRQAPWSDLPVLLLTRSRARGGPPPEALEALSGNSNVVLLERPIQGVTLVAAVRSALRARARQYATRDLLDRLAGSIRSRDQFLALLGHELRNPLGAITLASELLDRGADPGRPREIIARQSRKLSRLVDDLLEVSRVTSGKIELRPARLDLREVVASSLALVESTAAQRGVVLEVSLPDRPVALEGDAVRLEQVTGNLLVNAVKYTPPGGRVTVLLDAAGGRARLRVRDTGAGIPPTELERIFEPFAQARTTLARSEGGLGLGLALVRGLVAMHGGEVVARSDGEGLGSEFEVSLPLERPAALTPVAVAAPAAPGRGAARARRVLVVEDNPDNADALRLLLERMGHAVEVAGDGPGGVSCALAHRPEVLLVDIGLPGFDGYEVARRVRAALGPAPYLVALSGYGQARDREQARQAGFDLHLTKPATPERLEQIVGRPAMARGASA